MDYKSNIIKIYFFTIFRSLDLYMPIYIIFFLANSLTMTQIMILQTYYTLTILLFEIPSGVIADQTGRKKTIIFGIILQIIGLLVFFLGQEYLIFFLAITFWSIGISLISGADEALLFDSLKESKKENEYKKITGRKNSIAMFTYAISTIIGGILATFYEHRSLFLLTAILFSIGFIISLFFKEPKKHTELIEKNYLKHLTNAIKFSYTNQIVKYYIIFIGISGALSFLIYFLFQPYFNVTKYPELMITAAMTGYFIFNSFGSFFAEKILKKIKNHHFIFLSLSLVSLGYICLYFTNIWISLIIISITSFFTGVSWVLASNEINQNTQTHHRATVISIQNMFQKLIYSILAPFTGYIADIYSIEMTFLLTGIILSIFSIYYFTLYLIHKIPISYDKY